VDAAEEILKNSPPDGRHSTKYAFHGLTDECIERRASTWSTKSNGTRRSSLVETVTSVFRRSSKSGGSDEKIEED
jgi:hypothetical protein